MTVNEVIQKLRDSLEFAREDAWRLYELIDSENPGLGSHAAAMEGIIGEALSELDTIEGNI